MRPPSRIAGILAIAFVVAVGTTARRASAQRTLSSSHQQLARDIFRELIELDTTDRFGSTRAAEAVGARLKAAGFPSADVRLVGPRADRLNLVARLRGTGPARPVLFFAHLDVVEARREDWSSDLDPFRLTERDGYFYGRGTVDVKNEVAGLVTTLIRLRQEGFVPNRDIILALTADEEAGDNNGIEWLLRNQRDLIDSAYAINADAGGGQIERGRPIRYNVQTSEKAAIDFRLEVKNPGGHSSQPLRDNAIYHLSESLARLAQFDFPVRFNETTRLFFERMAIRETPATAADIRSVLQASPDPAAVSRLAAGSAFYNSLMRTTCVATMLEAGHARNALPQTATANVNCRLLPEDSQEAVTRTLTQVFADRQVTVTPLYDVRPSPTSPLLPEVMHTVEEIVGDIWPDVVVVPVMDPWATDGLYLRRSGIPVYGTPGVFFDIDPLRAHGKDERVGVQAFYDGTQFTYRLVKALSSGRQ